MGVQGLRKFIDSSGCTRLLRWPQDGGEPVAVDHVMIDMNGLIHACYTREHTAPAHTINAVLQRLEQMLRGVVCPQKTLLLAIDGPAPMMKLATQRIRRRKVKHMDVANSSQFSDLAITVGSVFLLQLEQAVARFLVQAQKDGWLQARNCTIIGSAVAGEGEHKISQALAHLAPAQSQLSNDSVVVVGNDIDLVLTCIGATAFHNLSVLSPNSLQVVDVGAFLQRWLPSHADGFVPTKYLHSARLDFVFLFQLNGGDHYDGLGDVAAALWRKYKMLRSTMPETFRIVRDNMRDLEVQSLFEVLGCQGYSATSDVEAGTALLQAAAWEVAVTVTGDPVDFQHDCEDASGATLAMVKSAVVATQNRTIRAKALEERAPLSPLQAFIALMPTRENLPAAAQRAAHKRPDEWRRLELAKQPGTVFKAAMAFYKTINIDDLSAAEKFLTQFGVAVDVCGTWWNNPKPRDVLPGVKRPGWRDIYNPASAEEVEEEQPAAPQPKAGKNARKKRNREEQPEPATMQDAVRAHLLAQRKGR